MVVYVPKLKQTKRRVKVKVPSLKDLAGRRVVEAGHFDDFPTEYQLMKYLQKTADNKKKEVDQKALFAGVSLCMRLCIATCTYHHCLLAGAHRNGPPQDCFSED